MRQRDRETDTERQRDREREREVVKRYISGQIDRQSKTQRIMEKKVKWWLTI